MSDEVKRDEKGRFQRGTKGGPGNPKAKRIHEIREAFLEAANPQRMKEIADKVVEEATNGNLDAAELLFDRVFGRGKGLVDMFPQTPEPQETPEQVVKRLLRTIRKRVGGKDIPEPNAEDQHDQQ